MELKGCDGLDDWRLVCPNSCANLDDWLRHFIADPAGDHIAVWGDRDQLWTGEGRDGLELLVIIMSP